MEEKHRMKLKRQRIDVFEDEADKKFRLEHDGMSVDEWIALQPKYVERKPNEKLIKTISDEECIETARQMRLAIMRAVRQEQKDEKKRVDYTTQKLSVLWEAVADLGYGVYGHHFSSPFFIKNLEELVPLDWIVANYQDLRDSYKSFKQRTAKKGTEKFARQQQMADTMMKTDDPDYQQVLKMYEIICKRNQKLQQQQKEEDELVKRARIPLSDIMMPQAQKIPAAEPKIPLSQATVDITLCDLQKLEIPVPAIAVAEAAAAEESVVVLSQQTVCEEEEEDSNEDEEIIAMGLRAVWQRLENRHNAMLANRLFPEDVDPHVVSFGLKVSKALEEVTRAAFKLPYLCQDAFLFQKWLTCGKPGLNADHPFHSGDTCTLRFSHELKAVIGEKPLDHHESVGVRASCLAYAGDGADLDRGELQRMKLPCEKTYNKVLYDFWIDKDVTYKNPEVIFACALGMGPATHEKLVIFDWASKQSRLWKQWPREVVTLYCRGCSHSKAQCTCTCKCYFRGCLCLYDNEKHPQGICDNYSCKPCSTQKKTQKNTE